MSLLANIITLTSAISLSMSIYPVDQCARGLTELNDWLEDTLDSEDPAENLAAIERESARWPPSLLNASKLKTVELLQHLSATTTNNSACSRDDLELIRLVQRACYAHQPEPFMRINKVVRPYALRLVAKCDQQHELELAQVRETCANDLKPLERILDENFIEAHRKQFDQVQLHLRDDHHQPYKCCAPTAAELSQLVGLASIKRKLTKSKRPEQASAQLQDTWRSFVRVCQIYLDKLGDTLERANSAAYFDLGKDFHFVAARSRPFQLAVFRYKFCQDVLRDSAHHVELLAAELNRLEPAEMEPPAAANRRAA